MILLLRLFYEYFKVGLFAVGGGMATIPFLEALGTKTGWFTHEELLNMIAVSESTPGPMGVNMASYVGYHMMGVAGSIVATLGLVAPSIIVILIVAQFLKRFRENRYVKAVMYGLRAASAGLVAAAGLSVAEATLLQTQTADIPIHVGDMTLFSLQVPQTVAGLAGLFRWKEIVLAVILIFLTNWKPLRKLHPIVFLAICAVLGVIFHLAGL